MIIFEEGFFAPAMAMTVLQGEQPAPDEQNSLFKILIPLGINIQRLQGIFREHNISYIDRAVNHMEAMADRTKTFLMIDTALFPQPEHKIGPDIEVLCEAELTDELKGVLPGLAVTGELHSQVLEIEGNLIDNKFSLVRVCFDDAEANIRRNIVIREVLIQGMIYGPNQEALRKKMEAIAAQYPDLKDDETRGSMMAMFSSWPSIMDAVQAWDEFHGDDFKDQVHVVM